MSELYNYINDELPKYSHIKIEKILEQSEKIECISERCEWIVSKIPELRLSEVRNILLR